MSDTTPTPCPCPCHAVVAPEGGVPCPECDPPLIEPPLPFEDPPISDTPALPESSGVFAPTTPLPPIFRTHSA